MKTFNFKFYDKEYKLAFTIGQYNNNKSLYIAIVYYDYDWGFYELYNDLTINLDNIYTGDILKENEIYINNDLSKELKNKLIELGFIKLLNKKVNQGFAEYEKAIINIEKIKEYAIKED